MIRLLNILCIILIIYSAPAQSILTNGDMELESGGNLLNWDYHTTGATVYTDPGFAQSGQRCAKLDFSFGDHQEWTHEVFSVEAGTQYLCRGYYRTTETLSSGAIYVVIRWFSSSTRDWAHLITQENIAADIGQSIDSSWILFRQTVMSPPDAIGMDLTIWSNSTGPNGEVYFDNFTMYKLLRYPGFEYESSPFQTLPPGWNWGTTSGAVATVERVTSIKHSGNYSMKIGLQSKASSGDFCMLLSDWMQLPSDKTYRVSVWAKGVSAQNCFLGISFQGGGDQRQYLTNGTFDWKPFSLLLTPGSVPVGVFIVADGVTQELYVDDFLIEETGSDYTDLTAIWEPKPFPGIFPRSTKPPAQQLSVLDCRYLDTDTRRLISVLQGIVNRTEPRIYLINFNEDEFWLSWMKQKGYTGTEQRYTNWINLFLAYKSELSGIIIFDPNLMGSIHAACMLGSIENALPVPPSLSSLGALPIIADLRGQWTRNVDAYRWIYDNYWDQMNHHILASMHPLTIHSYVWDYMAEFKIFTFWEANYSDTETGNDPAAEEELIYEIYANTSPIIPVLGWYNYDWTKGISEYDGVARASSFGKLTPGTEFSSNISVHSGINVTGVDFTQTEARSLPLPTIENDKVYIALSVIDSGDAHWYWQLYQYTNVWSDPERGNFFINWSLNPTIKDTMPDILQWYYENKTPKDYFFCACSGLNYVITPHFATRFKPEDKEAVWNEFIYQTSKYSENVDLDIVTMHNGGWGEPTPPDDTIFPRYISGIRGFRALIPDLGRHNNVTPANSSYLLNRVPVFHCTTRWDNSGLPIGQEVQRLADEIVANTPTERPAFMNAMTYSWVYKPSVIKQLIDKLPSNYVVVSVYQLAELYKIAHNVAVDNWTLY